MDNQYNYYNPNEYENNADDQRPKKKKKMPRAVAITGVAILFGVVSSATFLASNVVGSKILGLNNSTDKTAKTTSTVSGTALTQTANSVTSDVSKIVENVMPSVVSITSMSVQQVQNFFGGSSLQESQGSGSGIIISQSDTELLIVTNNHVVEGSDTLTVTFNDNTSVEANIKGTDASQDLAVIAIPLDTISDEVMDNIAVATLGDSTKLQVGEPAIAIGNALGYGQSVTTGVISATDRTLSQTEDATKLIQTDAAINPGNSGGALVNANGEVVGINSAKLAANEVEGMGYAIPISDVSDIITNLMNQETKTKVAEGQKGYLGIQGVDVTAESSQRYSMPTGVYVSETISGGGAEAAGLTKGNIITGLNGTNIDSMTTLQGELEYYAKGTTVTITVQVLKGNGEYEEETIDVTLTGELQ